MPRKSLIRNSNFPYHVTVRCNNREPFVLPLEKVWQSLLSRLFDTSLILGSEIHAVVLMPNHLHLLLTQPEPDLGGAMQHLLRSLTKDLNVQANRTGRAFGGRYHWTLVDSPRYWNHVLKYVYRNPVRANISTRVEDYPFSSLQIVLGRAAPGCRLAPSFYDLLQAGPEQENWFEQSLDFFNRPFQKEFEETLRKQLKKTRLNSIRKRSTRKLDQILHDTDPEGQLTRGRYQKLSDTLSRQML